MLTGDMLRCRADSTSWDQHWLQRFEQWMQQMLNMRYCGTQIMIIWERNLTEKEVISSVSEFALSDNMMLMLKNKATTCQRARARTSRSSLAAAKQQQQHCQVLEVMRKLICHNNVPGCPCWGFINRPNWTTRRWWQWCYLDCLTGISNTEFWTCRQCAVSPC